MHLGCSVVVAREITYPELTENLQKTREITYPELALKFGLLRVNSSTFRVLRVNFGSKLAFSGLILGNVISQEKNTVSAVKNRKA